LNYNDRIFLIDYALVELEKLENKNKYLKDGIKYLRNHKENLLTFVRSAEKNMEDFAQKEEIDIEALYLMWNQKKYSKDSKMYNIIEGRIGLMLGEKYSYIRDKFKLFIKTVVRASSIVECINSLIRPYLFLKRTVNDKFLDLLQFYFNTRKYRRSRCKERVGKSPIELLTGKEYPQPLEILGY
jgi:hypothetical protein